MRTAAGAYAEQRERCAAALKRLERVLRADAAEQAQDPMNWGHAGSLNHVAELLEQAADAAGGA